jgi:TetR/AcrR family transcriptional regulator
VRRSKDERLDAERNPNHGRHPNTCVLSRCVAPTPHPIRRGARRKATKAAASPPGEKKAAAGRSTGRRAPAGEERRRDSERSRARLLDAALEEFSRHGFAGARVGDIAERAGVNAQLIAYYFGGKDGLYRALLESWLADEAGFADPEMSLEDLIAAYIKAGVDDPRRARLLLWAGLAYEEGDDATAAGPQDAGDLKRRQAAGEIPADLDPEVLQLALMGMILAPLSLPQVARGLTGLEPTDPKFTKRYAEQLARIVRHLAD